MNYKKKRFYLKRKPDLGNPNPNHNPSTIFSTCISTYFSTYFLVPVFSTYF